MQFIVLDDVALNDKKDKQIFFSLSFYDDLNQPRLYINLKSSSTKQASNFLMQIPELKAVGVQEDGAKYLIQPLHLEKSGTLCFNDIQDIAAILSLFCENSWINVKYLQNLITVLHKFQNVDLVKFTQLCEAKLSLAAHENISRLAPVTTISLNTKIITQEKHITQAFSAVKRGDKKLLTVLLGNDITEQDMEELDQKRVNLDSHTIERYTKEFLALIYSYQRSVVEEFLKLNSPLEKDYQRLCNVFAACIYDAKEVIVGAKINYDYRPYMPSVGLDLIPVENFANWLHKIFEAQSTLITLPDLKLLGSVELKIIEKKLEKNGHAESISLMDLEDLRFKHSIDFDKIHRKIQKKSMAHLSLIKELLDAPYQLPEIYHYKTEAEKLELQALLQQVSIPIHATDGEGNTLLHYAIDKDNREIAILLIRHGIDVTMQNHAQQAAHTYAGKPHSFLLELQKIAHSEVIKQESPFLMFYRMCSEEYEPVLRTDESWLKSPVLKFLGKISGLDKAVTSERRKIKDRLDHLHQQAILTGNPEQLLRAIEQSCATEESRSGPRNSSNFYNKLLTLAQKTRADMEAMLGSLGAISTTSFLALEQELLTKNQELIKKDEIIQRITIERDQAQEAVALAISQNTELVAQNVELTTQNIQLKDFLTVQQQRIDKLETSQIEMVHQIKGQEEKYQIALQDQKESYQKEWQDKEKSFKNEVQLDLQLKLAMLLQRIEQQDEILSQAFLESPAPLSPAALSPTYLSSQASSSFFSQAVAPNVANSITSSAALAAANNADELPIEPLPTNQLNSQLTGS